MLRYRQYTHTILTAKRPHVSLLHETNLNIPAVTLSSLRSSLDPHVLIAKFHRHLVPNVPSPASGHYWGTSEAISVTYTLNGTLVNTVLAHTHTARDLVAGGRRSCRVRQRGRGPRSILNPRPHHATDTENSFYIYSTDYLNCATMVGPWL